MTLRNRVSKQVRKQCLAPWYVRMKTTEEIKPIIDTIIRKNIWFEIKKNFKGMKKRTIRGKLGL